jgi:hypothetical protein
MLNKKPSNSFAAWIDRQQTSQTPAIWRAVFIFQASVLLILVASLLVTDIHRIRTRTTGDFQHFYFAADAVRQGEDPYAAGSRGYIYPPLIASVFEPLSYLGRDRAAAVMLAVNVVVTLLAVALACDEFLRRLDAPRFPALTAAVMLLALLLNIDKVKGEWQMWQTDVFMLLLFVLSLRWQARMPLAAGACLGIAVNIKYLPLMFIPYLVVRRQWKVLFSLFISTVAFALLPAITTSWDANARNWQTATNGLLQMADVRTKVADGKQTGEAAEVHDVKDSLSCSITSAFARQFGPARGFTFAGLTALAILSLSAIFYRQQGLNLFDPKLADNKTIVGGEWVMLVAAVLAFGPQTNTRHLFDALILTSAASALVFFAGPRVTRWPLILGVAVMFFGFILPPGSRTVIGERTPTVLWLRMGGPSACLLVAATAVLWTTLKSSAKE